MKFIFRSLVVFAVAVGLGALLYFAVQALPNKSRSSSTGGPAAQNGVTAPGNQTSRPERPGANRNEGIRWGSIARIARGTFVFAVIVLVTVLAKNFLFDRGGNPKKIRRG